MEELADGQMCPASTEKIQDDTHSEQVLRQVPPLVDAPVHGDETVHTGFVPHVGIVKARVQHDDGKRQHVTRVCKQEMHVTGFSSSYCTNSQNSSDRYIESIMQINNGS